MAHASRLGQLALVDDEIEGEVEAEAAVKVKLKLIFVLLGGIDSTIPTNSDPNSSITTTYKLLQGTEGGARTRLLHISVSGLDDLLLAGGGYPSGLDGLLPASW